MGLAYGSLGLAAVALAGLVYFAVKALGAAESIAGAQRSRDAAEAAQRVTESELDQERNVTAALRKSIAHRDAEIEKLASDLARSATTAGVARQLRGLSLVETSGDPDLAAAPVPAFVHGDPDAADEP